LKPRCVRVAVHKWCVSPTEGDELRFFEGERSLREKSGIADVHVLGFRHEVETVTIWRILYELKPVIGKLNPDEPILQVEAEGLVRKLKDAFLEWHVGGLKSRLANCQSAVLGNIESIAQELHLLKEKREARKESSYANTEQILSLLKSAQTELRQFIDSLHLNDPTIFARLQLFLDTLTDLLANPPKVSAEIMSKQEVELVIERFRRWKDQLRIGFNQIEPELSKQ
jgi:hypothetical protein